MRETRQVEFKEKIENYKDMNKKLIAFLNDIGGELFVGIIDSGEYVFKPLF